MDPREIEEPPQVEPGADAEEPPEHGGAAQPDAQAAADDGEADDGEAEDAQDPAAHQEHDERTPEELEREVGALLFASPEPLSEARLAALLGGVPARTARTALDGLARRLADARLPFELRAIAGGWQMFTSPEMADTVARLAKARKEEKVSPAALETLAVVAYRQPVTKAEIEAIRGVQVGPILRTLTERGLVKVAGRSDQPGHPLLYGTSRRFLDTFGLASLEDLPRDGELLKD